MGDDKPTITSVRPTFKQDTGGGPGKETLVADRYLHPIKFGSPFSLAAGGAYYLGKDGKPYYPEDKSKPKPIPVADYVFYVSDHRLTDKEIEKLTRGDCKDPVSLKPVADQTIILKAAVPDLVFIMGKDANGFYTSAERYFLWEVGVPSAWIIKPGSGPQLSLEELMDNVAGRAVGAFRDVVIVSHANLHGWLGFPLERGKTDPVLFQKLRDRITKPGWSDASKTVTNRVVIRGCNIGQSKDMMKLMAKSFGGKCTVFAPTHKQTYEWDSVTDKVTKAVKKSAKEYFWGYWVSYKGGVTKSTSDLETDFVAKYPETDSAQLKKWVGDRTAIERLPISLKAGVNTFTAHPPSTKPDEVLAFAKAHWGADFAASKFSPAAFTGRSGPKDVSDGKGGTMKAYVYSFEDKSGGGLNLEYEVYPDDADVIAKEKAQHPDVDWYDWSVKKTPRGSLMDIQAAAIMTVYRIKKGLIDTAGKYIQADFSNTKFWGKSS